MIRPQCVNTVHAAHARKRMYDVCDEESRNDSPTLSLQLSVEVGEGEVFHFFLQSRLICSTAAKEVSLQKNDWTLNEITL